MSSNRRAQQAEDTRRLILEAACKLFAERGYTATSVNAIAAEAGVAVPTIYASVGTKRRVLELLLDLIEADADLAPLIAELSSASRPADILALQIRITRQLNERCGDVIEILRSAVAAEPDLVAVYDEGLRRHGQGCLATSKLLADKRALVKGTTPEEAAITLEVMTSPAVWHTLIDGHHLSFDDAERQLVQQLTRLLIAPRRPSPRERPDSTP